MSFLKKIFSGKKGSQSINTAAAFWNWFLKEERTLFSAIKAHKNAAGQLQKILDKLQELNPELYGLVGMYGDNTAELIITPDGDVKNIVFAEDIVQAAPAMQNWKITALKPEIGFGNSNIEMYGYQFSSKNVRFFPVTDAGKPDEIEIHIVHDQYTEDLHKEIANGSLIFLDNAIGEIAMATQIDDIYFDPPGTNEELIPIEKLKDYLLWREKEFIEKYEGMIHDTETDEWTSIEGQDADGLPLIAVVDRELLTWDAKASHPWMLTIDIAYKGNETGMPDDITYAQMGEFEETLNEKLQCHEGYLNTGRQTYNNERTIFFACKEFRECSRITSDLIKEYKNKLNISYSIYKDKYWKTMDRFC